MQISVVLNAPNLGDLAAQAANLSALLNGELATIKTSTVKTTTKKAAPAVETEEIETEEIAADDASGFDSFEDEAPTKKAKAKKITDADVNAAAIAYAKENGRPATLAILSKKFKVKSILELKADQYEAVIKALAV